MNIRCNHWTFEHQMIYILHYQYIAGDIEHCDASGYKPKRHVLVEWIVSVVSEHLAGCEHWTFEHLNIRYKILWSHMLLVSSTAMCLADGLSGLSVHISSMWTLNIWASNFWYQTLLSRMNANHQITKTEHRIFDLLASYGLKEIAFMVPGILQGT